MQKGSLREGCCVRSGSAKTSLCSLVFLTCCAQFFRFFLTCSQLSSGLFNQDSWAACSSIVVQIWFLCQSFVMMSFPLVSLVHAGVRAEGAGVRPSLTFSTASFKDESLGSRQPCPTSDPQLESSPSLCFDTSAKRHVLGWEWLCNAFP